MEKKNLNRIIAAAGVLQIIGAIVVYSQAATTVILEVWAAITLGMGVLTIAVAVTNHRLREIRDALTPSSGAVLPSAPQSERIREELAAADQSRKPDLAQVGAIFKDR
ncbi:hypothetical protein [Tianweitania sediminis]|uniref:Uncharacterized protein n=1 Tax=Tianweitania sediminis TaxID=1502156 RepID=A0A8J7UJ74_9HYPH|nr:hypothetical protein [Tianweitania sediminis]MBP0438389.1 hypothetical protein [Tianweitania sediminis]